MKIDDAFGIGSYVFKESLLLGVGDAKSGDHEEDHKPEQSRIFIYVRLEYN